MYNIFGMKGILRCIAPAVLIAVIGCLALAPLTHARAVRGEATVKAAFIRNFIQYVNWPKNYISKSLNVCILGTDPFSGLLSNLNGQPLNQAPVRVINDVELAQTKYCHVVFVSQSESGRLSNALLSMRQTPILTISDIEGFADSGGVIELMTDSSGRPGFRISQKTAQEVGLRVGSKLLSLSK